MDWIDTNLLISICTCAIGLTQFLFWRYIAKQKSYESEKGRNLATKEDIGEITKEIKTVESSFINETEKLKTTLSVLANIQTNVASIEREAIIELNKSLFTYLNFTMPGINNSRNNNELDKYINLLNEKHRKTNEDIILFNLFINDRELQNQVERLFIDIISMDTERQKDVIELKEINNKLESIKNEDIGTKEKREKYSKAIDKYKSFIEKMYDKQLHKYNSFLELQQSFRKNCRAYIYQSIEKPEH